MTPSFRSERCPCGYRWQYCPRRRELEFAPPAAGADRGPACREHGLKRPRRVLGLLGALAAAIAWPASAAQCPLGQIYRVHLKTCVATSSALARPYVHPRSIRYRAQAPVHHEAVEKRNDSGTPTPPSSEPYFQDTRVGSIVLPVLEDGVPTVWLLCQAAPNLCKGDR
jgi:hypothetical protein